MFKKIHPNGGLSKLNTLKQGQGQGGRQKRCRGQGEGAGGPVLKLKFWGRKFRTKVFKLRFGT